MGYFRDNIEKMKGYTPGFQPRGADIVKLNTNENPYPPSPEVLRVLAEFDPEKLRRYPAPLADAFREAAAQLNGVSKDSILCGNGADDLLNIAIRAICDINRPLAYPVPTYSLYPVLAQLQGCQTIEIPFDTEYNLPAKLATTGAALTIVCNPNAPTATAIGAGELASLADELKGILLIDEAYVDFTENTCVELVASLDNVIIVRSMSKGYSLAGLRFGYAIAQLPIIEQLVKVKDSYNVGAIPIAAATAAIKDQQYFRQNVEKIKQQRQRLTRELRNLHFAVTDSSTNFLLAGCIGPSAAQLHEQLAKRDIYVRYFDLPGLADKLRITVGTPQQNDKLLAALKDIIAE